MAALWYIDTDMGCGIRDYRTRSIIRARHAALREVGSRNFNSIREATADDVEHVRNMGGRIPNE